MRTKEEYESRIKMVGYLEEYEEVVCPHCFAMIDDPMVFSLDDDGDIEEDVECESCHKMFDIIVKVEKTYTTTRVAPEDEDGDDE